MLQMQMQMQIQMQMKTATALIGRGEFEQATNALRQILSASPNHPEALHTLGMASYQLGRTEQAVALMRQAIAAKPSELSYQVNLGNVLYSVGQLEQSLEQYRQVLRIRHNIPEVYNNAGAVLSDMGRTREAVDCYRKAIALRPLYQDAHVNLGKALVFEGLLSEAISCHRQVVDTCPTSPSAHNNLGTALQANGDLDEAIACHRRALELKPDLFVAHSNLLFAMQYSNTFTPEQVFEEHQRYATRVQSQVPENQLPLTNVPNAGRLLKIGYVSGDFRQHPVAFFVEPILAGHDKSSVEVFCYYSNSVHDAYTGKLASHADHWLNCNKMDDEHLAQHIMSDGIDILVDLSGHTASNRLPVFARKPAPIQITWIGYPGTTGLDAMDYRITDAYLDPPGLTDRYYSEALIRLPVTSMLYQPVPQCPPVNELPALRSGAFVFASLNNLKKINQAVVNLWGRILKALPQAKLMMGNVTEGAIEQRIVAMFASCGIGSERLLLRDRMPLIDYLELHHQIDVALDPFPYNGGTITNHSLWMGVPVITMAGKHTVSRMGVGYLASLGLTELIVDSEDEYLQLAIKMAQNLPALNQMRQSLRTKMQNPEGGRLDIVQALELVYRDVWTKWCTQHSVS